jgi:inhibitor of cysteine peptidase
MKKTKKTGLYGVLFILSCVMSMNVFSASKQVQVVFDAASACFEIRLPASPSTGFQMTLQTYDKSHFDYVKDNYVAPDSARKGVVGGTGEQVFYFKKKEGVAYPTSGTFCFRYARPWMDNSGTCTAVEINFPEK